MAFVPGMPTNLPDEAKEKAQASYDKQQSEKSNSSSSSSDYDTTKTTVPGMPSDVPASVQQAAQTSYDNQQAQKSNEPDPYSSNYDTTKTTVPGMPSNISADVQQSAQSTYDGQRSETSKEYGVVNFINSLSTTVPTYAPAVVTPTKILEATNPVTVYNQARESLKTNNNPGIRTVQEFHEATARTKKSAAESSTDRNEKTANSLDKVPTSVKDRIISELRRNSDIDVPDILLAPNKVGTDYSFKQQLLKSCQLETDAYNARIGKKGKGKYDFDKLLSDEHFRAELPTIPVRYATAVDWEEMVRIEKTTNYIPYRTVFVEEGNGKLQDKKGVYTIGRENLVGLPDDVKTIYVNRDNEWLYVANSGDRAEFIKTLTAQQEVKNTKYTDMFDKASANLSKTQHAINIIDKQLEPISNRAAHDKLTPEDRTVAQALLEQRKKLVAQYNIYSSGVTQISKEYSSSYADFLKAVEAKQGWTVEDENNYRKLNIWLNSTSKQASEMFIDTVNKHGMPTSVQYTMLGEDTKKYDKFKTTYIANLAAYQELSARRAKYKDNPVYMDLDAIEDMRRKTEAMQKYVDEYNYWDSCTLNFEAGDGVGKALAAIWYNATDLSFLRKKENTIVNEQLLEKTLNKNTSDEEFELALAETSKGKEVATRGLKNSLGKLGESLKKTVAVIPKMGVEFAKTAFNTAFGRINLREATKEYTALTGQFVQISLNNLLANIDVFDITSLEKQYTAFQMARHPELYSDDPKFKKIQEAYKATWGTDYRGKDDALRTAWAMHEVVSYRYDDYIYVDSSDLRHSNGEQYGVVAATLTSMLTDPTVFLSAVAKLGETAIKGVTAHLMQESVTEAIQQALTSSGVQKEVAEAFVHSKDMQEEILRTSQRAIRDTFKNGGDEVAKAIVDAQQKNLFRHMLEVGDDALRKLDFAKDVKFSENAIKALDDIAPTLSQKVLQTSKATVVTSTIRSAVDILDDLQHKLFIATCPVAAVVKGTYDVVNRVSTIVNKTVGDKNVAKLISGNISFSLEQAVAKAQNLDFDTTLSREALDTTFKDIDNTFQTALLETKKAVSKTNEVDRVFRIVHDDATERYAKGVVYDPIRTFSETLRDKGLEGLDELARTKVIPGTDQTFSSFSEMYEVIKTNSIEVLGKYSKDVPVIIQAFDDTYKHALAYKQVEELGTHIAIINEHTKSLKDIFKGNPPALTAKLVKSDPDLVQSTFISIRDSIQNFVDFVNPKWTQAGDLYLFTYSFDAHKALSAYILEPTVPNFIEARKAVTQYYTFVDKVYSVHANDAYTNLLYKVSGEMDYSSRLKTLGANIGTYEKNTAQELIHNVAYEVMVRTGANCSVTEIEQAIKAAGAIVPESEMSGRIAEEINRAYKVILNKGSNMVAQVNDKNVMEIADMLNDVNSPLYSHLYMYKSELSHVMDVIDLPEVSRNYMQRNIDLVDYAIDNATAMRVTRTFEHSLEAAGLSDPMLKQSVMDSWCGNYIRLNNLAEMCSKEDDLLTRVHRMLTTDVRNQTALHNGTYQSFHTYRTVIDGDTILLRPNSVDVGNNVVAISKIMDDNNVPVSKEYRDICFSTTRVNDGSMPKDIGFYVRGEEDATPTVFRKNMPFDVRDDQFAGRVYGQSAESARAAYGAIDQSDALTQQEWLEAINRYITEQQDIALKNNQKIRLIGFNSSDSVSGDNKFLNDIVQQAGVSIDTASALDYADELRRAMGELIITGDDDAKIMRALASTIRESKTLSLMLDATPKLSYDTTNTFVDALKEASKASKEAKAVIGTEQFFTGFKQMFDEIDNTMGILDTSSAVTAYETGGDALSLCIDIDRLQQVVYEVTGVSDRKLQKELATAVANTKIAPNLQLGLRKMADAAYESRWFNRDSDSFMSVITKKHPEPEPLTYETGEYLRKRVTSSKQLSNMYGNARRLDLVEDSDRDILLAVRHELLNDFGRTAMESPTPALNIVRAINENALDARELYVVDCWMIDKLKEIYKYTQPEKLEELPTKLLAMDQRAGTMLSDVGRDRILHSVVDHTNPLIDDHAIKYFSDTEDSYRIAMEFEEVNKMKDSFTNLEQLDNFVHALYTVNGSYGVVDNLQITQAAAVGKISTELQKYVDDILDSAKAEALEEYLAKGYDPKFAEQFAAADANTKLLKTIAEDGDVLRANSVKAAAALDADAFKAHLIRNCGGGLVIEPGVGFMKDIPLPAILNKWRASGLAVEEFNFKYQGYDRQLIRVYVPNLGKQNPDALFQQYNHTRIKFINESTNKFNNGLRRSSFDASDMSLMMGSHMDTFRELFFDGSADILDLSGRFNSWADEMYCCNMWTSPEIKRLVNPYYTDNFVKSIAQNTHQLRNNMMAFHDLGTIMDNPYMKSSRILELCNVYDPAKPYESIANIKAQLKAQGHKICAVVSDDTKFRLIDYTYKLDQVGMPDAVTLKELLDNTILVDDGMFDVLSDWASASTIALKYANAADWQKGLSHVYKLYSSTIRSGNVAQYLYRNLGTAFHNITDSTTKAVNEVLANDVSMSSFVKNYVDAVPDSHWYANKHQEIESLYNTVNRETIRQYFGDNADDLYKFNLMYGFENTVGGGDLTSSTLKECRAQSEQYLIDEVGLNAATAKDVRKVFDSVYSSVKYRGMNNAEIIENLSQIQHDCMEKLKKIPKIANNPSIDFELLAKKFYNYKPTVASWGEKMTQYDPIMKFNQKIFNDAETRARLSLFKTFFESGDTEAQAMKHVTATQFDYSGMRKVETFMPFTQYKIYNALYWFDHADTNAVKLAYRFAQHNDDGIWTAEDIATMCAKYIQRQYYLYDSKADDSYTAWVKDNVSWIEHALLDGVDSYIGLPRGFQYGNIDLTGTHYLKFGNSFVEELDLITSAVVGTYIMSTNLNNVKDAEGTADKLRAAYDLLKCTPLYDSLYSPWKSYLDFMVYVYDRKSIDNTEWDFNGMPSDVYNVLNNRNVAGYAQEYLTNKSTHSLAVQGIPLIGALISNISGRLKAGNLNLGELQGLMASTEAQSKVWGYLSDFLCDITGGVSPSVVGTYIPDEQDDTHKYNYYRDTLSMMLVKDPTNYIDFLGRLQKMGFQESAAKDMLGIFNTLGFSYYDKKQRLQLAEDLYARGYTPSEISNLLRQVQISIPDTWVDVLNILPDFLKYDSTLRTQAINYYKAMGYNTSEAWALLAAHPIYVDGNGNAVELTPGEIAVRDKIQNEAYWATHTDSRMTKLEWDAYWAEMKERGYYPTRGQWRETYTYLKNIGYSDERARQLILGGTILNDAGELVDIQTVRRAKKYSSKNSRKNGAYAQYGSGSFSEYSARVLNAMGYPDFNTYYQTLPEFIRYEKGAFKRINNFLKEIGVSDYGTRLALIQQGAYLIDATGVPGLISSLEGLSFDITSDLLKNGGINNINDLMTKLGGKLIKGTDGKYYVFANCTGLQRPRKTNSYSRKTYNKNYNKKGYAKKTYARKGGKGRRSYAMDRMYSPYGHGRYNSYPKGYKKGYKKGRSSVGYKRSSYSGLNKYMPMMSFAKYTGANSKYYTRSPFVRDNNVSTYSGMTGYRGSSKPTKYTTNSYRTSTYSLQNFLHGASYGMRKVYRIDMRQYKTGAYSTKRAYPAAYRNIAVAYRHNLYKDMYAKYGASRMMMRANKAGYSNASIVRLRRNEIYNRERYAERRDRKAETKKKTTR